MRDLGEQRCPANFEKLNRAGPWQQGSPQTLPDVLGRCQLSFRLLGGGEQASQE